MTVNCDDCGSTAVRPRRDETVVRGDRAYRTLSEQYRAYFSEAPIGANPPEGIPKWTYYCPECAADRGLAPRRMRADE